MVPKWLLRRDVLLVRVVTWACCIVLATACRWPLSAVDQVLAADSPLRLPTIRVHNPTDWNGTAVLKVPVGRLASPGLIDWNRVVLQTEDAADVPVALCEGRPHWKANLTAPVTDPRSEDLLVFACEVVAGGTQRFQLIERDERTRGQVPTLSQADGQLLVSYPNCRAAISLDTGMLQSLSLLGASVLERPLAVSFSTAAAQGDEKRPLPSPRSRLVGSCSNAAVTTIHFVLDVNDRLSMALTYHFFPSGMVELRLNGRPWQGISPWVDHEAVIDWQLAGQGEPLPHLQNRAPFYGFKDFDKAVRHIADVRQLSDVSVVELGEETTNGRCWSRQIAPLALPQREQLPALIESLEQGMVVELDPCELLVPEQGVVVWAAANELLAAARLTQSLEARQIPTVCETPTQQSTDSAAWTLELRRVAADAAPGLEGDGFEIRPALEGQGATVTALTRFGLLQAVQSIQEHLARGGQPAAIPLIASNPVVNLRAGGFGGGDMEVDFPYGDEAEWHAALELLAASGMNVMTDLGMWSNWKMPVTYRLMPELRSAEQDAYDEVSGARLSELDLHRERGLRLLQFLHERGVQVWLWLPVGCVPTTYAQHHPDAMAPGKPACPCFTHPLYARYLEAFLTELLETYPIDGIVMIRDDNGGLCPCPRCQQYVEQSKTRSAAWEQYLILYRWLREKNFAGDVAVYPYWDYYQPQLEAVLPADLMVVGHGAGATVLARDFEHAGPMGDTWIDNLYANFRVAGTARMRRLLSDRSSFWIGGALRGLELPWQSIGRFGWEPSESVNTFRFQSAARQFGPSNALCALALLDTYEQLWELYDVPLLPHEWMQLTQSQRVKVSEEGRRLCTEFDQRLTQLRSRLNEPAHDAWLRHVELFGVYFSYQLRRLELFAQMHAIVAQNREAVVQGDALSEQQREMLLSHHAEIYALAKEFDSQAAGVPGNMMARTRALKLTQPFKEFVAGYDPSLDARLQVKQFDGVITVPDDALQAGQPFTLRVRLQNLGVCPWIEGVGHRFELQGNTEQLGLPAQWELTGQPMVLGDQREVLLQGTAPREPGSATLHIRWLAPYRHPSAMAEADVTLRWQ